MITLKGTVSWFGGPHDKGVSPREGLAIYDSVAVCTIPDLFLKTQPHGTTGLARRLNPDCHYIACRWDYKRTPVEWLRHAPIYVTNPRTGMSLLAHAADWGPNAKTGRVADLSLGLMRALDLETDEVATIVIHEPGDAVEV